MILSKNLLSNNFISKKFNNSMKQVLTPVVDELLIACFCAFEGLTVEDLKNDELNNLFLEFKQQSLDKLKENRKVLGKEK